MMSGIQFTCITCRVAFNDADSQRAHYKADWHRYNLKRKVADLAPVSSENFQQRVLAQTQQAAEVSADQSGHCGLCNKHFHTHNAFLNHLNSRKHRQAEDEDETEEEASNVQNMDKQKKEKGMVEVENEKNLKMKDKQDGSFVNISHIQGQSVKVEGAVGGLLSTKEKSRKEEDKDKISVDISQSTGESDSETESWDEDMIGLEECLFCAHLSLDLDHNVDHMTSHGFYLPDVEYLVDLEGLITYLGEKISLGHVCLWCNQQGKSFHTKQSVQQHMMDKGHCKMMTDGDVVLEYSDYYDYRPSYPDESESDPNAAHEMETDVELTSVSNVDSYQLVLPSGSTVGHRSLQRYYRQNLPPERAVKSTSLNKVIARYKSLGWTGVSSSMSASASKTRMKDLSFVQRSSQKLRTNLAVKANKLQPHLRNQVIF